MNIELYIANKLCDLEKSDLSIRLKRQFINPSELNTKDAQKSYGITLPSTPTNDEIFKYSNVEETENKFALYPDAKLYVNGILILDGKFRLSEITSDSYRGNLGVPAPLTVKDVFGEMKMNEAGNWELPDWERQKTMSSINKEKNPVLIFPLAMYKLFNRDIAKNSTVDKERYDEKVQLDFNDLPPSINCISMLQKIFSNADYNLTGTAMTDERLKALYVSNRNANDYPINWDIRSGVTMEGDWQLLDDSNNEEPVYELSEDKDRCIFNVFEGEHHSLKDEKTNDKDKWIKETEKGIRIVVPEDGLYKISFTLTFQLGRSETINNKKFEIRQGNWKYDHSSEICLIKKNNRELKDYKRLFLPDNAQGIQDYKAFFSDDNDFVAGYSMGKTKEAESFKGKRVCTPMVIKGSAAESPGYGGKYKIRMKNGEPTTWAKIRSDHKDETMADGSINQIVWLEKGDVLEMINITSAHKLDDVNSTKRILYLHNFTYNLSIQPFQKKKNWLNIDENTGSSKEEVNWFAIDNYYDRVLNITQFLPSEVTINDWIDNFCKAFNLNLSNVSKKTFSLDVKNTSIEKNSSLLIDLDKKTNVQQRQNEPLNLPMQYELGFTVNNSERGYVLTSERDAKSNNIISNTGQTGGGRFSTNSINTNILKQNSNFSYCWYRPIKIYKNNKPQDTVDVPIITDNEIWDEEALDYKDMMEKKYFNKAQRFWFKKEKTLELNIKSQTTTLALVTNTYNGDKPLELNYEDKPNSIMRNYFMLLTNEKNYTVVECYLTPEEYNDLDRALIRFNGDMYIVAEADGYDPMGKSKTKLKLIKKM